MRSPKAAFVTERDVHYDFFTNTSSCPVPRPNNHITNDESLSQPEDQSHIHGFRQELWEHVQFAGSLIRNQLPELFADSKGRKPCRGYVPGIYSFLHFNKAVVSDTKRIFTKLFYGVNSSQTPDSVATDPSFTSSTYLNDLFVGISIGAMSIPQGMSYAMLAGLSYQYGLYNNLIHPIVYFIFGSSKHALVGVSAVENLMIGESISTLTGPTANMRIRHNAAILLSILSGLLFFGFYVCKLAIMADLLADPVLSGFATAAAFLVSTSQLKHAFGMAELKSDWGIPKAWFYIISHLELIAWQPVLLCVSSMAFLFACKASVAHIKGAWFLPGPLLLVIAGCLISFLLDFSGGNVIKTVGQIPGGLPSVSKMPTITLFGNQGTPEKPLFRSVLLESVKLSSIFFIIHVSITKSIALRQGYKVDYSQELLAFSMTNIGGSLFQCYPTCTSISRSSVAEGLGSKNGLQGPMASLVVLITLIYLTNLLEYLPMPCLAAVVFVGVSHMTEFGELRRLWTLQKAAWQASNKGKGGSSPDLFLWCVSFLVTVCLGATEGLLAAAALSLIWIGKSILRPPFMELGRLPGTTIYRDILRFPHEVEIDPHIAIYRIDAPLNFCNAGYMERIVHEILEKRFTVAKCCVGDINFANALGLKKVSSGNFEIFRKEVMVDNKPASQMPRITLGPTLLKEPSRQSTLWASNNSSDEASAFPHAEKDFQLRACLDRIQDEMTTSPDIHTLSPSINSQHPPYVELTTSPSIEDKKISDHEKLDSETLEEQQSRSSPPNIFILDCSSVNGLDVTAIAAIKRTVLNAASMGVIVAFSNWKGPQRDYLWRADFYSVVPPQRCFLSNYDAYLWACALRYAYGKCDELRMCPIKWSYPLVGSQSTISSTGIARNTTTSRDCATNGSSNLPGLSVFVPNVRNIALNNISTLVSSQTRVVHEQCGRSSRDWEVSIHDNC